MVVYVNFCKDIFMFEAAMASEVLLHNGFYVLHRRRACHLSNTCNFDLASWIFTCQL